MKNFSIIFNPKSAFLLIILSFVTVLQTQAQGQISGKVMDPTGEPATLVNVEVLNKANKVIHATVTDIEGNYALNIAHMKFETVRFSYLGFETMEINAHLPNSTVQMISSMKNVDSEQANISKIGLK